MSIAHDIQDQETEECHALAKKSSTRVRLIFDQACQSDETQDVGSFFAHI